MPKVYQVRVVNPSTQIAELRPFYATPDAIERICRGQVSAERVDESEIEVSAQLITGNGYYMPGEWRITDDTPPTEQDAVNGLVCVYFVHQRLAETARWEDVAASPTNYPLWQHYPLAGKRG